MLLRTWTESRLYSPWINISGQHTVTYTIITTINLKKTKMISHWWLEKCSKLTAFVWAIDAASYFRIMLGGPGWPYCGANYRHWEWNEKVAHSFPRARLSLRGLDTRIGKMKLSQKYVRCQVLLQVASILSLHSFPPNFVTLKDGGLETKGH